MQLMKKMVGAAAFLLACASVFNSSISWAAGAWSWKATLDGAASGQALKMPTALYVDGERQRYYVVDSGGNRLLSFERDGAFLHAFSAEGKLLTPFDMVRDEADILWVVEKGRNSLTRIDVKGKSVTTNVLKDGERTLVPDRLDYENRTFYLLDRSRGAVAVIDKDLRVSRWFECAECQGGIADFKLVKNGMWALDPIGKKVQRFSREGEAEKGFSVAAHVRFPVSIAVDQGENVYVLDRHGASVAVFDGQGNFKYSFLGKGWARGELYYPAEIVFDPWGRLCVTEEGNGRVGIFGR
ncbi:MAG: hypothetical protein ACOY32_14640 [Thermodesulfobacteriota bacterium]